MTYSYRQYNNCHLKNLLKATLNYNFALYWHQRLTLASKSPQNTRSLKYTTERSFLLVELPR